MNELHLCGLALGMRPVCEHEDVVVARGVRGDVGLLGGEKSRRISTLRFASVATFAPASLLLARDRVAVRRDRPAAHRLAVVARLLVEDPDGAAERRPRIGAALIRSPPTRACSSSIRAHRTQRLGRCRSAATTSSSAWETGQRIGRRVEEDVLGCAHLVRVDEELRMETWIALHRARAVSGCVPQIQSRFMSKR